MGQQLLGRPISQRQGFATLNTASNPFSPDLSQFRGFMTPEIPGQQLGKPTSDIRMPKPPFTLGGFRGNPMLSNLRMAGLGRYSL